MTHTRRGRVRRRLALLVAGAATVSGLVGVSAPLQAAPAGAGASGAPYDAAVSEADCDLLGREFTEGGCSRVACVDGAVPFRTTYGAEACALRGQPRGFGFVATVDVRQCQALRRRWIAAVNYCASEPDRAIDVLYHAPQCTGAASVYVPLEEVEGYYDECLTLARAAELTRLAVDQGTSLAAQVSMRSAVQCAHRPLSTLVDGLCVRDPAATPAAGGTLLVGDSLSWRGGDELARLRGDWTIDAEPGRPASELARELVAYRAGHDDPTGLIIELGTVPSPGFTRHGLTKVIRTLPHTTRLMLVLPHFEIRTDPVVVSAQSRTFGRWMRALAASRAHTCLADWPAYVAAHRGVLQDGVHTTRGNEGRWARWLVQEWGRC